MQYVFFEKGVHSLQWGLGQKPPRSCRAGELSRIFVLEVTLQSVRLKVTLQSVKLLLTVSYRIRLGEQDVLIVPQ